MTALALQPEPDQLRLAFSGLPLIPVRVWEEEGKWKKQPLVKWDEATKDETQLERWWRKYPDALPGIPLRKVGWAVVDVDDPNDEAWVSLQPLCMLGPHSRVSTPSGGTHLVFAQPSPPIDKFEWSPGVEVLGTSCLPTVHDVDEILFPKVAPRAILPEVFREPYRRLEVYPSIKGRPPAPTVTPDVTNVASLTEALFKLDACEWRGRHDDWLALAMACKAVGISCRDFVRWSTSDPHYAADERDIERKWHSFEGKHGGVRRQNISDIRFGKLRECLAHLV
jgi:hypothetical protein